MKRLIMAGAIFSVALISGAQSLAEIAEKNFQATNQQAFSDAKTIRITAKGIQGGMEIPMVISMKNPEKVRVDMSFQGMAIIQAYDGVKGYMVNPMMGSNDVVELSAAEAANMKNQANFTTNLVDYFKQDKIELAGDVNIDGKPAWKIKQILPTGDIAYLYVDKSTFLQVKSDMTVNQMGIEMNIETYLSDFTDFGGVLLPKMTTSYANGTEMMVMIIEKVELNIDMDDKLFTLK
ncbi:MAG: hypothetical protein IH591_00180 [Bacteroidales bacterium]|nr:hypothetical protein [Bacteroidales bacterium]